MVIFGTRFFGQVDRVPGLMAVRTKFFHINFVPLLPLASWVVFEGTGRGVDLKKVRWNSVLFAWLRTALWVIALVSAIVGLARMGKDPDWHAWMPFYGAAAGAAAAWFWSYRTAQADFDRAAQLAQMAQLSPEMVQRLEQHFGRGVVPHGAA